jgi:hypothetical protein
MPMARKDRLVIEELDGELLIYDLDRDKAHCLNGSAAIVWQHCDGSHTVEDLGALIAPEGERVSGGELARDALEQLSRRRLLEEPFEEPNGVSRRDLMRTLAVAGAIGLSIPVVKSIVAPTAAQAATLLPPGANCSNNAQCASNLCVAGVCL